MGWGENAKVGESKDTNMGDGVARVIAPDTVPHSCAVGVTDRVVLPWCLGSMAQDVCKGTYQQSTSR